MEKKEVKKVVNTEKEKKSDEKVSKTNNVKKETKTVENKTEKVNEQSKKVNDNKKNKLKRNLVLLVFAIALVIVYIFARGQYLEVKEIGQNYVSIFWQNFKYTVITALVNFFVVYFVISSTTKKVKNGLKTFFDDEKKKMPKLPHKSISFIIATLATIFTTGLIVNKAMLCINNAQFVVTDPVFKFDAGFFVFVWPFLQLIAIYAFAAAIVATVYGALYYLIVFNICFDGISRDTVKKSVILDQALAQLKLLIVFFAILLFVNTLNVGVQKFMTLTGSEESEAYELFGAGSTEIFIKFWAYSLLSVVIVASVFRAIKHFKDGNTRKVVKSILVVPAYLAIVLVVMLGYNLIFVNSNALDKEKQHISDNIKYTKMAYGVNIDETDVNDGGTINGEQIASNSETIKNIPITNSDLVLKDLKSSLSSKGYYDFTNCHAGLYSIKGYNRLVFLTPREITNSNAYSNKTYEYTHGYGTIVTSATDTTKTGNLDHIQKSFENTDEALKVTQPRIYFGVETNNTVVTNSNGKKEFDYPTNDASTNTENNYDGAAGLKLSFLDKIVLAIKEKDPKLAFSGNVKSDSKILTNRHIIQRAKTLMPYLTYDSDPYMVIRNNGEQVWVLDAYTTSNNYPYSQRTVLENSGITKNEINYIRNSVKVIINAYTGEVKFYITDVNDPIAVVYKHIYSDLFSTETIPEDISTHFTYPKYLYKIQSEILKRYHNVQPDVLYRNDDVWDTATHNTTKVASKKGTKIDPYFTMVKTTDSDSSRLGLVLPYTPYNKQNIKAYLVGSVDENGNNVLKLYNYPTDSNVVGPMQLDTQIEQDTTISKELDTLNVSGTKTIKDMIIVPIDNTLLYIEPIYQQYVNETDSLPTLKKVIVASGSKVAIGEKFTDALSNLISKNAVEIEVKNPDNMNDLVDAIIKANTNLKESTKSSDWEQIGKDSQKLQTLVSRLEEVKKEADKKAAEDKTANTTNTTNTTNTVDENTNVVNSVTNSIR